MTIQLTSPVLRMTKPMVTVPLPHHASLDVRDQAMFNLENNIVHPSAGANLPKNLPLDLIHSISEYLTVFPHPFDHKMFIIALNTNGLDDKNYMKTRNLIALTPRDIFNSGGVESARQVMNGLSLWEIYTDRELLVGHESFQAQALMHVTLTLLTLEDNDEYVATYYSGDRRAKTLLDPELVDLVKDYPEHHKLISETIQARQGADAGLLREMVSSGSRSVNEGQL